MSGTVELVLAVEATAASEWMAGPASADRRGRAAGSGTASPRAAATRKKAEAPRNAQMRALVQADAGAAIADALTRMPGIAEVSAIARSTVQAFVEPDGSWCILHTGVGDGPHRVTAVHADELVPGVWRCETVCDEPLELAASSAFIDAVPEVLQDALGKPDKIVSLPALVVRRGAWRWSGPDGATVDVVLHDACPVFDEPAHAAPIAFCELRLISRIDEAQTASGTEAQSSRGVSGAEPAGEESAPATEPGAHTSPEVSAVHALFAAAGALTDTLPLFPALTDGYTRACARGAGEAPVRAARVDLRHVKTPHDALIAVAANITRQWFGNESGVRGDPGANTEFVHQMRVAQRRLKTLLKTFPRWADATWERTIAPDLDWLGGLLGQARDLDVFVDATLPALAAADVDAAAWAPLQARASARRDEARTQVQAALRTRRYAALSLAWLHWLASQRFSSGPSATAGKSLASYAAKRVRKHHRRLLEKPELTALTPAQRHRRRIEAKRLRYTLEFFQPLASRKTRRKVAKQLGRIQSVLGDGSDATAALRFLEALDVPPYEHGFARGWCEAVNRWSAIEGERLLHELGKPKIVQAP